MNTENSNTNEPHRFRLKLVDKLNLKDPNKYMALANLHITHEKINLHITTINLKFQLRLEMMNLIFLMDNSLFQTFKITLSILSKKNMKLSQIILPNKFTSTKSKIKLFLKQKQDIN